MLIIDNEVVFTRDNQYSKSYCMFPMQLHVPRSLALISKSEGNVKVIFGNIESGFKGLRLLVRREVYKVLSKFLSEARREGNWKCTDHKTLDANFCRILGCTPQRNSQKNSGSEPALGQLSLNGLSESGKKYEGFLVTTG